MTAHKQLKIAMQKFRELQAKKRKSKILGNGLAKRERKIREPFYLGKHKYLRRDLVNANMYVLACKVMNTDELKPFKHLCFLNC